MKEYISTPEGTSQMWDKINEVLDSFDFSKVAATMEALDWTWFCTVEEAEDYRDAGCIVKTDGDGYWAYRPEYPQLLATARKRILETINGIPDNETHWSESTGGFKVEVWISTDEERNEYWKDDPTNTDDFAHSVDIALYFIAEEYATF